MKLFSKIFGNRSTPSVGQQLYESALAASRRVTFYQNNGAPDTVDGRFDLLVIHVWLLLRRLNQLEAQALGQEIFDAMFADMDNALREMGISDTVIGKRIKDMAKVFYGRAEAYNEALDAEDTNALSKILNRNLYSDAAPISAFCHTMASYMRACEIALSGQDIENIIESSPCYPPFA
jgi:cytochrome b pre-mRNA-processing protein 3